MTAAGGRARGGLPRRIAHFLATLVYRDIDVHVPPGGVPDGPVLAVSNHFGGLSDGVLIVDSMPRMPRIVARDVIWKVPVLGRIAPAIGMIPVHRGADGTRGSNDQMFSSTYAALGHGDLLVIFPEGVTQDVPYMAEVRTGAARIALGARESGVAGIHVLPIGLHYENKAGFRSRSLVNIAPSINLDEWAAERPGGVVGGADDHDAVRDLTAHIDEQLRRAAPDFPDWSTADALSTAAEVLLNDVDPSPAMPMQYGDKELLAARLNRSEPSARASLIDVATQYHAALARRGTADRAVALADAPSRWSWRWAPDVFLVLFLLPYALVGLVAAAFPLLAVNVVARLPVAPAVRATAVPGVALLAFLGVWALVAWQAVRDGGWALGWIAILTFPFFLAAVFLVHERVLVLWQRWRAGRPPPAADRPSLAAQRARVAELAWGQL